MAHATFVTLANFDHQTIETIAKSHSKTTKIDTAKFHNYQKVFKLTKTTTIYETMEAIR